MKSMRRYSFLVSITLLITCVMPNVSAAFGLPSVSNVRVTQQTNEQALVDIYYDLIDERNNSCTVYIAFDSNGDGQFDFQPTNTLRGAFGNGVVTGLNKHIAWNIKKDFPSYSGQVSTSNVQVNASAWNLNGLIIDQLTDGKYSSPFLLDFDFVLRDSNSNAVIANPHAFALTCKEDDEVISATETANFMERFKKQFNCFLVLDYTRSMDTANAIPQMEKATKLFIDSLESYDNTNALNPDTQIGLYEFHAEDDDPNQVSDLSNNKKYLLEKVDSIWDDYVHQYPAGSRCWDAVGMAVNKFSTGGDIDEYRYVIFLSDGVDESSITFDPDDIITDANTRDVRCLCIGFGDVTGEAWTNLTKIAEDTGGQYYPAAEADEIVEVFKKIIADTQAKYTLRWETIKNGTDTFKPSFEISALSQSVSSDKTFADYTPSSHIGNRREGILNFTVMRDLNDPSSVTAVLRSQYSPRHIHQLQLNLKTEFEFEWDLDILEFDGFCPNDWIKEETIDNVTTTKTLIVKSPKPYDDNSSEFIFGGFGRILVINFKGVTSINQLIDELKAVTINNDIYADYGEMTFVIDSVNYDSPVYKLDLASRYPSGNVSITADPYDQNFINEGKTPFYFLYDSDTTVELKAPETTNFPYSISYAPDDTKTVISSNTFGYWDDGVSTSTNLPFEFIITDNIAVTAVYKALFYQLNVQSDNPNSGIYIETSRADINGYTNGATPFPRLYNTNAPVTLSAPLTNGNNLFSHWLLDGEYASPSNDLELIINQDHVAQAMYYSAFTLTINSRNPDTGVAIQVLSPDLSNRTDGVTQFERIYLSNTLFNLTAPISVVDGSNTNKFDHWQVNNINYGMNPELVTNIAGNTDITAVYVAQDAVPGIALYENSQYIPNGSSRIVNETLNGNSVGLTFTITNTGTATLDLTGTPPVVFTNSLHNYFKVCTQPISYISPGCADSFSIRFAPTSNQDGNETSDLTILNSSTNTGTYVIHMGGEYIQMPEAPVNLTATDGSYTNRILVKWNANSGENIIYRVFRNDSNTTNGFIKVSDDISSGTSFTDFTVTPGKLYYYWVQAGKDKDVFYWSTLSASDSGSARLSSPTYISATDGAYDDKVIVTWSDTVGAISYSVYRSTKDNSAGATLIGTTTNGNSYTDTTAVPSTIYYYWIGAVANVANSELSESDSGYVLFTAGPTDAWKYKDGNNYDVLKGKKITPILAPNLSAGWQIGLATISTDGTLTNFDGPHSLVNKNNKNKYWLLKNKKEVVIKYKYNEKNMKDKLLYKLWKQMPESKVLYLIPPTASNESAAAVFDGKLLLGIELEEKNPEKTKGWRELIPVIIQDDKITD